MQKLIKALPLAASLLALSGCMVGPDYVKPDTAVPVAYKELDPQSAAAGAVWKPAQPQDAVNHGAWWGIYKDPLLDDLEHQIDISNQNLKAAEASYRQARSLVAEARAGLFPTIGASGSAVRSGNGGGRASGTTASGTFSGGNSVSNQYSVSADASWDLDVWGRIRRTIEEQAANAQAGAADLASARLSAQAALAGDYFQLRVADEQIRLLKRTVEDYQRSLEIVQNQYKVGVVAQADIVTAQTQLLNAQAQLVSAGLSRAQLEHAIAVLVGKPPADFTLAEAPLSTLVPVIPVGVPSTLLERRPDIAAAERNMQAANAAIGIAEAAYYPDITLSASYGYAASTLGHLFEAGNKLWSVGPAISETIFDGGLRGAQMANARAGFDVSVANYRQTVLTGFQQVEDQLAGLRILEEQGKVEDQAAAAAREAARLTMNQYRAGIVTYTGVITAQATALASEQTALAVLQNRQVASVALIEALGGGWDAGQMPSRDELVTNSGALFP